MNNCIILTHRGLEPSNKDFYPESSYEAFKEHLEKGFGIEFDPNFTKDGIIVYHDGDLKRLSNGKDGRKFSDIAIDELKMINYGENKQGRLPSLKEVIDLIKKSDTISALHLKGKYQTLNNLDLLIKILNENLEVIDKLIIFDVKLEAAQYLKEAIPGLHLAPSVAHDYDISRYNECVAGTLLSVKEALENKNLYDWVWLDEWDTADENGMKKIFYTEEIFKKLKGAGYKIALVTPELHATSPGLYGGESHNDAKDKETLFARIKEILDLKPDAICTDYPEEIKKLIKNIKVS